ncbi:hypothetical protein NN561_014788 [Cricetulus griseus]
MRSLGLCFGPEGRGRRAEGGQPEFSPEPVSSEVHVRAVEQTPIHSGSRTLQAHCTLPKGSSHCPRPPVSVAFPRGTGWWLTRSLRAQHLYPAPEPASRCAPAAPLVATSSILHKEGRAG